MLVGAHETEDWIGYLPEILAPAVADLQRTLAEHPMWRIMILGDGERASDELIVVYPDAIRILQMKETDSMSEAIKANALLRLGKE